MPKDTEFLPFEIKLDGKLNTADSSIAIGKNFRSLKNLRYDDANPKGVSGMTKINATNPLDATHQHVQNAFHFVKDSPAESHVLVQTVKAADDTAPAIVQNTTAIPSVGDFEGGVTTTELYNEDTAAEVARFSDAPNGQVAICDGKESLIWGGDESRVGAALTSTATITTALTNPKDYTSKVNNASDDADQRMIVGGGNDSNCIALYNFNADLNDSSVGGAAHNATGVNGAAVNITQAKFGQGSLYLDGTNQHATISDHADFDWSADNKFTIDTWVYSDGKAGTNYFYNQQTNGDNSLRILFLTNTTIPVMIIREGGNDQSLVSSIPIVPYKWFHLAFVGDGTNYYIFVNGELGASQAVSKNLLNYTGASIYIGTEQASGGYWEGYFDEPRITKGIARWTSAFTPPAKPYAIQAVDWLVGFTRPLQGCKFYVASGSENTDTSTLSMKEWNGNGWTTVTITDNTKPGSISLAQTGTVTWASTVDTSKIRYFEGWLLYWYNFTLTAGNVDIYQITVDAPVQKSLDIWDGELRTIFSYQIFSDSNFNDYTVNIASDSYNTGNDSTFVTAVAPATALNTLLTVGEYQYVGSLERLTGLEIHIIGGQGNAAAGTMEVAYWDGSAWVDATNVIDGTLEGGVTFAKSGVITWQVPDEAIEFKKQIAKGIPLYFYRLHGAADFSAVDIQVYYIAGIPAQNRIGNFRFPLMADNCLWLCDDIDYKRNEALRSFPNAPDVFNGLESFRIAFGDEKKLTCATVLNSRKDDRVFDVKLFYKFNSMHGLTGNNQENYSRFVISDTIGCPAPLTLATTILEVENNVLPIAIWQGANGLYIYNDFKPIPIHRDIRNFFDKNESASRRINKDYIASSVGFVDEEKREYHWLFADGNSTGTLNREFVFDLRRFRLFEIDRGTGKELQCGITVEDTDGNNYNYGFIDTGYMERLENGTDFDGTDITSEFQIGDIALYKESSMYQTIIRHLKLIMGTKTTTTNTATMTHYGDGNNTATAGFDNNDYDPTKSGYDFTDVSKSVNLSNFVHHSLKASMTTDDETVGFSPIKIGGFYKVVREDKGKGG